MAEGSAGRTEEAGSEPSGVRIPGRGRIGATLAFVVLASTAQAQSGQPQVTDGDTLKIGAVVYRLWGIDAPEIKQDCPDGWAAGRIAASRLQALIAGRSVACQARDTDRYGRTVAICRAGGEDLGALMVREGLAWAFVRYSADYVAVEERAKAEKRGVHAHGCQPAWEWRASRR